MSLYFNRNLNDNSNGIIALLNINNTLRAVIASSDILCVSAGEHLALA